VRMMPTNSFFIYFLFFKPMYSRLQSAACPECCLTASVKTS
jgi:hypothetical protein